MIEHTGLCLGLKHPAQLGGKSGILRGNLLDTALSIGRGQSGKGVEVGAKLAKFLWTHRALPVSANKLSRVYRTSPLQPLSILYGAKKRRYDDFEKYITPVFSDLRFLGGCSSKTPC